MLKKVRFNDTINIHLTYSSSEYDRMSIDSILYRRNYKKVTDEEWEKMMEELLFYKNFEMIVHMFNVI